MENIKEKKEELLYTTLIAGYGDDGFYEGYDPCADAGDYLACRESLEGENA